jgi:TRAP-type C4-dicarboxylate transport system substrate-binding protein
MLRRWCKVGILMVLAMLIMAPQAWSKGNPLAKWKAKYDMSKAKYVMKVSNVSHPVIEGVGVGYRIRDSLWKRTDGQIALKFYPLCQLGGEVEVLNMLQTGTIQGMMCSSVAVTNLAPRMGMINLPFLVNSFDKLDKFVANKALFQYYMDGMLHQGVMGLDITGYGNYGWASTVPIRNLEDAKDVKFRIAEAAVNKKWFDSLPADLQKTLVDVIHEECAKTRVLTRKQEDTQIAKAKEKDGVTFFQLSAADHEKLRVLGDKVHKEWANQIGVDYLKKVQDFMGYKRILDY